MISTYKKEKKLEILNFFKKVFKENDRILDLKKYDYDLNDIENNYIKSGNFWFVENSIQEIIGTIALRYIDGIYEVRRFFVLKKYQNTGIGKKLFETLIDFSISQQIQQLYLGTYKTYNIAKRLFEYYGFEKCESYRLQSTSELFYKCYLTREFIYNYEIKKLKRHFETSLILNPTENLPFLFIKSKTNYFEGLYVSDRQKNSEEKVIFGGRNNYLSLLNFIKSEWCTELRAEDVDLKSLSGLNAHLITFLSILKQGDKVLILPEGAGGHFATSQILKNIGARVFEMFIDNQNLCINQKKTIELIQKEKINYIFVDRSEGLHYEDFSWLKSVNAYKIFDASQYLSSIISEIYINPFDWGFDMIISTLHKNYPGPQKALVATQSKSNLIWQNFKKNSAIYFSNTHPKGLIDTLAPLLNKKRFVEYMRECHQLTSLFECMLIDKGLPIIKRKDIDNPSLHIWLTFDSRDNAYDFFQILENLSFHTNYRLLPYELGYGLRFGIHAAILQGVNKKNINELVSIITEAYYNGFSIELSIKAYHYINKLEKFII